MEDELKREIADRLAEEMMIVFGVEMIETEKFEKASDAIFVGIGAFVRRDQSRSKSVGGAKDQMSTVGSIFAILKSYDLQGQEMLSQELSHFVENRELREFEAGVVEGRSCQAKLELQARDRFMTELRQKAQQVRDNISQEIKKLC